MKEGEKLMDRGQLREAQATFVTVMDEMPFPVIFNPRHELGDTNYLYTSCGILSIIV